MKARTRRGSGKHWRWNPAWTLLALAVCCGVAAAQQSPVTGAQNIQPGGIVGRMPGGQTGTAGQTGTGAGAGAGAAGTTTSPPDVRSIRSTGGGVASARTGGQQGFNPTLTKQIEWVEAPDGGQPLTYNATANPVPVMQLAGALAQASDWNVVASSSLEEVAVRIWATNVQPATLLKLLRFSGIYAAYDPSVNLLRLMTVEEHILALYGTIEQGIFEVKYANVVDVEQIFTGLLSDNGKLIVDPRTGTIIVWDTPDNLKVMTEALEEIDQPLEERVFQLEYMDAGAVLENLSDLLSEVGFAHADLRSNSIVVTDLPSRQDKIGKLLDALDVQLISETWTLQYAEPEDIADKLAALVPEEMGGVTYNELTRQVTATAIPARIEEINGLLADWDVPRPQVEIQAYLVVASKDIARNLGIDWSYFDEAGGTSFALRSGASTPDYTTPPGNQQLTIGQLPYQVPLVNAWTGNPLTDADGNVILDPEFKGNRISAVMDFLEDHGEVKVLQAPRVTVADGEEATFEDTRDRPYQTGGYSTYNTNINNNDSNNNVIPLRVEFVTVGTVLKVTPRIGQDDENIVMEVEAEDSDATDETVIVGDQRSTIPSKQKKTVQTVVMVHNGQTIVIGGLRISRAEDDVSQFPILGDIPLLGKLFQNTTTSSNAREIMIFITPTIVDEFTQAEASRLAAYDEDLHKDVRHENKDFFGRLKDKFTGGKTEISVQIGQTGAMFSEGRAVVMADLEADFAAVEHPSGVTVVIYPHPDADPAIADAVEDLAEEMGLKSVRDERLMPFVPEARPGAGEEPPAEEGESPAPLEIEAPSPQEVPAEPIAAE